MDIIDRAVRALLSSAEELLPGSPISLPTSAATTPTSSSTSSPASTNNLVPGTTYSPASPPLPHGDVGSEPQPLSEAQYAALELVLRLVVFITTSYFHMSFHFEGGSCKIICKYSGNQPSDKEITATVEKFA